MTLYYTWIDISKISPKKRLTYAIFYMYLFIETPDFKPCVANVCVSNEELHLSNHLQDIHSVHIVLNI